MVMLLFLRSTVSRAVSLPFFGSRTLILNRRSSFGISGYINGYAIMKTEYPVARRDESVVENYHGVQVQDPYRWLEDPDSEETQKFVEAQNAITKPYLEECSYRSEIKSRLTELFDYPKYSCPFQQGDRYFFYKNSGLQNQSVLYVQDSLCGEPRVFLDPNTLSDDGTVALTITSFSEDDEVFAYGLSTSGSDWFNVHFKHVIKGDIYNETLKKLKFSELSWTHDNKGLFYSCYKQDGKTDGSETQINQNHKLYYHLLGTSQEEDVLVVEHEDPDMMIAAEVSVCGRYFIASFSKSCNNNMIYFSDLKKINYKIDGKLDLVPVVSKLEKDYEYITNTNNVAIFKTNKDASNYKLILVDFENPSCENWKTFIEQHDKDVLKWACAVNENYLVVCYIRDVKNVLQLHRLDTGELVQVIPLDLGTILSFKGRRKYKDIFYNFSSFLTPSIIYHCDLSKIPTQPIVFRKTELANFDPDKFTSQQIFYSSKDGTKIPMYIIHKKCIELNSQNPCMLYGYGGFNISLLPFFKVSTLVFLDNMNGVYAIANIRGGGEYGEDWHKAGRIANKQNVFDDFQAAAEYLIKEKYTKSDLLSILGGSNGGLLVTACANQRPDLFKAVISQVGVLDMLRFHKFTIGYAWISDYGSSDNKDDFPVLLKYSPLHTIKVPQDANVQYPGMLLLTADHDDRVVPFHSLKFIAELQNTFRDVPRQTNPLMIHVETKAGHGTGKPLSKSIDEWTDIYCFLCRMVNISFDKDTQ